MAVGVWFDAMLPQSRRPGLTWPASPTDAAGRPIEGDGSKLAAARGAPTSCDDRTCKAPIDTVRPRRGTTRSPEPSGVLDSPWRGLVRAPSTPGSSQALACSAAVTGKRHSRAWPGEACGAGGADGGQPRRQADVHDRERRLNPHGRRHWKANTRNSSRDAGDWERVRAGNHADEVGSHGVLAGGDPRGLDVVVVHDGCARSRRLQGRRSRDRSGGCDRLICRL